MRRILGIIVHNWPLKLAAIGLATLMYGGLALSQNTQTFTRRRPDPLRQRADGHGRPAVDAAAGDPIRYFAPPGVQVATSSFLATVDLSGVERQAGVGQRQRSTSTRPIRGSSVLGYDPAFATVDLDALKSARRPGQGRPRARRRTA